MSVKLQIIGSGALGSGPSVYLTSDNFKCLFNCGEGTQRLALEHKFKLSLENIFMTKKTWDRFGGVPGMCLTIQTNETPSESVKNKKTKDEQDEEKKKNKMFLHGPTGMKEMFAATDKFVYLNRMDVEFPTCSNRETWSNDLMQVTYLHMKSGNNYTMAYLCKLKDLPGRLDAELCRKSGVKSGPMMGALKRGLDVTLDDGTVVKASSVCGPKIIGATFIFIDVPDESYFETLDDEAFEKYQNGNIVASIVVHFTPKSIVMQHDTYRRWMEKFSSNTAHWFVNDMNTFSGLFASNEMQLQLNHVYEKTFPMLAERLENDESLVGTSYNLGPLPGPNYNIAQMIEISAMRPAVIEKIQRFRDDVDNKAQQKNNFPKIITLGTGSCIPSKTRNFSSNLIHLSGGVCALLDCGEGTLGQLVRFYGIEEADKVLKKLKMIYISHAHADHHLGLMNILARRQTVAQDEILVLAPNYIKTWLEFYSDNVGEIKKCNIISCDELVSNFREIYLYFN